MRYILGLAVALAGVWLLLSGHYTPLLLSLGGASVALVLWITRSMSIVDREGAPVELPVRLPFYLPWLLWEIAKANVDVALRILNPRLPIAPRLVRVRAGQSGDVARVIYANSITLTPGTVTIDEQGEMLTVHALTTAAADGLLTGEMDRRVTRLEGER